jgi:hypothetical protein
MKRLMVLAALGTLLVGTTGCRVAECWRYAWNSRFHPQQTAVVSQPCCVTETVCDPCGGATVTAAPCASCAQ